MRGIFILVIWMNFLFFGISYSQTGNILEGIVVDETNESLPGASIILYPEMLDATTDAEGKYIISNLENGTYIIEVSFVGYKTIKDSIVVSGYTKYNAKLELRTLSLQEVVVKDDYAEERKKDESLNIEIVNDEYLKQNRGGSLMNSLERLPGVSTINIGSDQSKPIIRGLGFNRVVVVENGIKHEAQQWGEDHGLEQTAQVPARVHEVAGQPVQEPGMGRGLALHAEVLRGGNQPTPEDHLPIAVHRYAGQKRVIGRGEPLGQAEPVFRGALG